MEQQLGLRPAQAAQLAEWCRGLDSTPVQERGPPKQVSVSMSLTPQLIKAHPAQGMPVAGGRAGEPDPLGCVAMVFMAPGHLLTSVFVQLAGGLPASSPAGPRLLVSHPPCRRARAADDWQARLPAPRAAADGGDGPGPAAGKNERREGHACWGR